MTVIERVGNQHPPVLKLGAARRLVVAFGLVCVLVVGSSGCSLIGDALQQKTTLEENLEYQKISAQKFISNWPQVETITFTREGRFDGSGEWSTNAIVTIEGKEYQEIVGPWETAGDPLPDPLARRSPERVRVTYSDGSSEVLG